MEKRKKQDWDGIRAEGDGIELPKEISSFLEEEARFEVNQGRRYYYKNTSIEYLRDCNVPIEQLAVKKNDDIFNEAVIDNPDFGLMDIVEDEALVAALSGLKRIDVMILTMKYRDGLSLEEIGVALNKDRSTVGKRHKNAIDTLKKRLTGRENTT